MIEDWLQQSALVEIELYDPSGFAQDTLGGAVRTAWRVVASGVPCLVRRLTGSQQVRQGTRTEACDTRIYFASDPVPGDDGLDSRCRITVDGQVYQVTGVVDLNSLGRLLHVDTELVKAR